MNQDYKEMLSILLKNNVEFVIVGAYSMAVHGRPRATGDIDIFVNPTVDNSEKVFNSLLEFGAPPEHYDKELFQAQGNILQMGVEPRRIDIITSIDGVEFDKAYSNRETVTIEGLELPILGLTELIENKSSTGRDKDKLDVKLLKGE